MARLELNPDLEQVIARQTAPQLMEGAGLVAAQAQQGVPVDTHELQQSIEYGVSERDDGTPFGWVLAGTDHAAVVEFGTEDTPPQPYLRPALGALDQL